MTEIASDAIPMRRWGKAVTTDEKTALVFDGVSPLKASSLAYEKKLKLAISVRQC